MLRAFILCTIQSFGLALGQIFLKLAVERMPKFEWTWSWWGPQFTNWWLLAAGAMLGGATLLWMYIIKLYPVSIAHPLTCTSYLFSLLLAMVILGETVPLTRWIGVVLVVVGLFFIVR